tara:strand:- start:1925 stop:2083 length:159 start_codon:yes stop_codon:yes gene_type:complete
VIDEREEKQEKKTSTEMEITDRNISSHFDPKNISTKFLKQQSTKEMVDIAKI